MVRETLPIVYIVILNWNGHEDTIECLESNYKGTYRNFEVVVVDNGSTDDSLIKIKGWAKSNNIIIKDEIYLDDGMPNKINMSGKAFTPGALNLIETNKNLGFSGGNNRGIQYALLNGADYIFLLNNDILVKEDTLGILLAAIQDDLQIAAVFPKVLGLNGELQVPVELRPPFSFVELLLEKNFLGFLNRNFTYRAVLREKSPYPEYGYDRLIEVPNIVIAGALHRREVFEEIGLLDEKMFMYYEEGVFLRKLEKTKFKVYLNPFTEITHKVGGDTKKIVPACLYIKRAQSEYYYSKNYMYLKTWQLLLLKLINLLHYGYYMFKSKSYREYFSGFLKDYLMAK